MLFFSNQTSSPLYTTIKTRPPSTISECSEQTGGSAAEYDEIVVGRKSWLRRHFLAVVIHCAITIANLVIYNVSITRVWDPAHAFTPLGSFIEYKPQEFEAVSIRLLNGSLNPDKPTAFGGDPRPALEAAWKTLTKNQNLRLTDDDLLLYDKDDSIVKLTDGTGSYATLTVFHNLHCIERLHRYLYFDHYYSQISKDEVAITRNHAEHCLDYLRQSVMCNADTTPILLHWIAESATPVVKIEAGKHSCVNWDHIDDWVADHTFVPSSTNLKHPIYGDPYSDDTNRVLGFLHTGHHFVSSNGSIYES